MVKTKVNSLVSFVSIVAVVVALAIFSSLFFSRFDLSEDNRYTLKEASINLVENLEDQVFVRVYLEGEFPAEFRKLRNATKELLDELRAYGGENIQYEFIDPSASENVDEREKFWRKLSEAGLKYTNLTIQGKDGVSEKIIFPGAIIACNGKEQAVQLLKTSVANPNAEMIQGSINNLEYNLISGLSKVLAPVDRVIALIKGTGELPQIYTEDLFRTLKEDYLVDEIKLKENLDDLLPYDMIIVPRSSLAWTERNKFILDQFIMRGGDIMFYLDGVQVNMDSVFQAGGQQYMGLGAEHNLYDMLFNYGVRINKDLILDQNCGPLAVNVGQIGDKPNIQLFPWPYFPLLLGNPGHPISANIDPVIGKFVSSIDTLPKANVKTSVLLKSSLMSRVQRAPVRVNLNSVAIKEDFSQTATGSKIAAVILEGEFNSLYKNRIPPAIANSKAINFLEKSTRPGKIIVAADGAIIKNEAGSDMKGIYPLGYDKFLRKSLYGNKTFLLNAVNYLLNDESLIEVRSRNFALRMLNKDQVLRKKFNLQMAGVVGPLMLVLGIVLSLAYLRKRKYA